MIVGTARGDREQRTSLDPRILPRRAWSRAAWRGRYRWIGKRTTSRSAPSCCSCSPWPRASCSGTPTPGTAQAVRRYEIYFDGSVSGLSEGSTVRYLGVAVGRVTRIGIDPRDPRPRARRRRHPGGHADRGEHRRAPVAAGRDRAPVRSTCSPRTPGLAPRAAVESLKFPVIPSEQSQFDVLVSEPAGRGREGRRGARPHQLAAVGPEHRVHFRGARPRGARERGPAGRRRRCARDVQRPQGSRERDADDDAGTRRAERYRRRGRQGGRGPPARRRRHDRCPPPRGSTGWWPRTRTTSTASRRQGLAEFEQLMRETRDAVRSFDTLTRGASSRIPRA